MAEFDPSNEGVDRVLKHLAKADAEERDRVLAAELAGKRRVTVLNEYGIDPDTRLDASGRALYPWETDPKDQTFAKEVTETPEEQAAREAQAEQDALVAQASDQGGSNPPGTGVAPPAESGPVDTI